MTVYIGQAVKAVVHIIMPQSVDHVNVFYFESAFQADQDDDDVVAAVETWVEALYTTIDDLLSDELTMGDVEVYKYDSGQTRWDLIGTADPSVTFAATSEMLPHGVSALVRAYTTNPRVISRKYIGGLTEGAQEDGVWNAAALSALADFGNAWDNTSQVTVNNLLAPACWSTKVNDVYGLNDTEIALANPAYQRRRRPGVGS